MTINEQLYNAYVRLVELSTGGNVELWNRIEVPAKRMQDVGWVDVQDGSYATVYSSTFSNDSENQFMNFTPIMKDGDVLTPEEFYDYCFGVVNGEIDDTLKLKIGRTYSNLSDAIDAAIESHEVSEVFYELRDAPKDSISALEFKLLKERVKNECSRRKYNGSVASYADSSYDYSVEPTEGETPRTEHFNKIIVPMNAIEVTGKEETESGHSVREIYKLSQKMTTLESIGFSDASSGCSASCTGLCQGTCVGTCSNGCTTGCTGSCKSGCKGGCKTTCSSDGCTNHCDDACAFTCSADCTGSCDSSCTNGCKSTCTGGCKGGCKGTCIGAERNPIPA